MARFQDNFSRDTLMDQADKGQHVSRPLNAFIVFCNLHRQQLKQRMPHLKSQEVSKYLGELWAQMTADHKELYYEEARRHRMGQETHCACSECHTSYGRERVQEPSKKRIVMANKDKEKASAPAQVKFGGYVPPFHVYSAQLKRLQKIKACQQARTVPLPSFKTFMSSNDQAVFKCAKISSPNCTSPTGSHFSQFNLQQQMIEDENSQAVASIMGSPKLEKDYDLAATSIYNMFLQRNQAATSIYISTPQKQSPNVEPHHSLYRSPNITTPQPSDTSSTESPQSDTPKQTPRRGQKRVWMESYNSGLAKHDEVSMQDQQQDQRSTQSEGSILEEELDSGSELSTQGEEATNYVLVPCDADLAKMLGWPVHLLQKVSKPMLDRFEEVLQVGTGGESMPLGSVPMVDAKTVLAPHLQVLANKAVTTAIHASDNNVPMTAAPRGYKAITTAIQASGNNAPMKKAYRDDKVIAQAIHAAGDNVPVVTQTHMAGDKVVTQEIHTRGSNASITQAHVAATDKTETTAIYASGDNTFMIDDDTGLLQPPNPHNSVTDQPGDVRTTVPLVDPIEPPVLQDLIGCPRVWRPKFMTATVKHLHSNQ